MLALCLGSLVGAGVAGPAQATQATGTDAVVWQTGWKWTYATTFKYNAPDASATVTENLTATVVGTTTFNGQSAYQLSLSGNVTGGSGSASGQSLTIEGGSISGSRYVRRSDLALLQEHQVQHLDGCGGPFCAVGFTADVDLTLNPSPTWHQHDFPLNAGDAWQVNEVIDYNGSFTYDAGSLGGSGGDTLNGSIPLDATANVSNQTISAAGGSVSTLLVDATNGNTISRLWWSAAHKNDARDYMKLPLDDAVLEMDRVLSSSSTPAPANTISETVTSSLTCAGDTVTVAGALSTAASGVPVTVTLDQSQISAGQTVSASTTTGANGAYSTTLTVPAQSDGLQKNGSRANWGVLVSAPSAGANNVATLVVTPKDCSTMAYTGPSGGAQFGTTTVTAKLTDKASAGGAAGRTVTFSLSGGTSVNATTDGAGVATASLPIAGPPRNATITTSFAGSSNLEAASDSDPFTVTKAATATTVMPSSSTVTIGDPVTFTAHVDGPAGVGTAPGGAVQFVVDGANFGAAVAVNGSGNATSPALATGTIGLGNHTVQAIYNGDANFATSTSSSVTFRVRNPLLPTTTTEVVTPSSAVFGQTVTLSADVSPGSGSDPVTGSVTFSVDGDAIGQAGLDGSGHASFDVSSLPVGTHSVVATYSGDDVYNGSSSAPVSLVVAKADVQVGLSTADDHSVSGEAVSFTATVGAQAPGAGTPTGTVQLVVDGNNVGQPVDLVNGAASFDPVTSFRAGTHTVAVSYSGDSGFKTGSASATQHVTLASTTTSLLATPSPSAEDQPVTIAATVAAVAPGSGAPTGTVVFTSDGDVIGAAPLSAGGGGSHASLVISTLAPGSHTLAASYAGDDDYAASDSSPVSHTVIEGAAIVGTSTSVTSSENPSTYGELITFTATVEAADDTTPTGSVQFSVDGADFGDPVELDGDGVAESPTLASPEPGDHTVIAAYLPTAGYSGSGDLLTQTVEDAGVDVALESSDAHSDVGQGVTFGVVVSSTQTGTGTPSGFVQFRVDGNALGDAVELVDGEATSPSIGSLEPGAHAVTALYSGDAHFLPGSDSLTQEVAKIGTSTALQVSPTSPTYGDPVTLTATVTPGSTAFGAPTGTVTFRDGSTTLATVPVAADGTNATATAATAYLGGGSHTITAEYSGAPLFDGSTSPPVTVHVARRATTLTADAAVIKLLPLGLPLGQLRATLTSSLGPVAGQPVVFAVGAKTVCVSTTNASGVATCNAASQLVALALNNGYNAAFLGNADYLASSAHGGVIK